MRYSRWLWCSIFLSTTFLFSGLSLSAVGETSRLSLSLGVEGANGDYGGDEDIEDLYIPITAGFRKGSVGLRLTVPYIQVRAPTGTTIIDDGGQITIGDGPSSTESGVGDIIGSITFYDIIYNRNFDLAVDLTTKTKLGTADVEKGLGTGENDYSLQTNIYKYFGPFCLSGSLGRKWRGDPPDLDLQDVWFGSLGGVQEFSPKFRGGIIYYYRQSAINGNDSLKELSAFISHRLNSLWVVQLYALSGLSDSSLDWGSGILIKRSFNLEK